MDPCIECCSTSKYKCPICRKPYCSVVCYKKHKEVPCTATKSEEINKDLISENKAGYEFPTEDTVPIEKLIQLETSSDLKKSLNDPYLRKMLAQLDQARHPDNMIQEYMHDPLFTIFVDKCLEIVQTDSNK